MWMVIFMMFLFTAPFQGLSRVFAFWMTDCLVRAVINIENIFWSFFDYYKCCSSIFLFCCCVYRLGLHSESL